MAILKNNNNKCVSIICVNKCVNNKCVSKAISYAQQLKVHGHSQTHLHNFCRFKLDI